MIKSAVMVFSTDALTVVGSGASIVFQKYLLIVNPRRTCAGGLR